MKKLLFFCSSVAFIILISCNNSSEKKKDENDSLTKTEANKNGEADTCQPVIIPLPIDPCTSQGSGNLIIDPGVALRMIGHFRSSYQTTMPGLNERYWVEKCGIEALKKFFDDHPNNYDGTWIAFGAEDAAGHSSTIHFVPTKPNLAGPISFHTPDWAAGGTIKVPAGCSAVRYFGANSGGRTKVFRREYRKEPPAVGVLVDKLSRGVWVNKCVYDALVQLISLYASTSTPIDGAYIYSAVYKGAEVPTSPVKGYLGEDQATVVIVPSYSCPHINIGHIPGWQITQALYDKLVKVAGASVYNHGELCPNACLDDEPEVH